MMTYDYITTHSLGELLREHPLTQSYLENLRLTGLPQDVPLLAGLMLSDPQALAEFDLDAVTVVDNLCEWLGVMEKKSSAVTVNSITILGGHDKSGVPENLSLTVRVGEVVGIVGPTGSGKSRLLEDIECLAQGDTPTGRQILINGAVPAEEQRYEMDGKLVAQLSQNMNFVMDLTVREFLEMHARSRLVEEIDAVCGRCFACANELAGEPFPEETKVTQLSGGQSRALMIADAACMSESPIVLVDEIENAGIDRQKAIALLAKKEKIVLISTHDPLLALSSDRRIVIKNGGISRVVERTEQERQSLSRIEALDAVTRNLRALLRAGETITPQDIALGGN